MNPFDEITRLAGTGPKRAEAFRKLGIQRIIDLVYHLPRRYEDRRILTRVAALRFNEPALIEGRLEGIESRSVRPHLTMHKAKVRDESGMITVAFFNQDYILSRAKPGDTWTVYGVMKPFRGGERTFHIREIDLTGRGAVLGKGRILPFYPASAATPQRYLRKIIHDLVHRLDAVLSGAPVYEGMPSLAEAARMIHMPRTPEEAEEGRRRLAMDELVMIRLCVERARRRRPPIQRSPRIGERRVAIPFTLTDEQERIRDEIFADMDEPHPMRRLVEGDVGSGKTVLAILAAARVAERGMKTAVLAPTEILAEQHFLTWSERLRGAGIGAWLLMGATKAAERKVIHAAMASDEPGVFFGTHALLTPKVAFRRLGLVVIDEQQRFGVAQREEILRKGEAGGATPDLLILTATPIPRTLAMAIYGDLEISTIRKRLPGRRTVPTLHLRDAERKRMMPLLNDALKANEGVYMVYPIIDEAEELELRDAKGQHKKIAKAFPQVGTALLTGATKSAEKERVMRQFRDGAIRILVATSVVEVGLDVPDATLMVIEHAEHFGLAQLHQLRGRVGRSDKGGNCVLTTADEIGEYAQKRIDTLVHCHDGFEIAEQDLILRGTGEILGERQSGGSELRVTNPAVDRNLIGPASDMARKILDEDPALERHEFFGKMATAYEQSGADAL